MLPVTVTAIGPGQSSIGFYLSDDATADIFYWTLDYEYVDFIVTEAD